MSRNKTVRLGRLLRLTGLVSCLGATGSVFGDTVVIDNMTATQGTDVAPAAITNVVGGTAQNAAPFQDPSILWLNRIVEVTHTAGVGPSTSAYVDGGIPSNWAVANPPGSSGWGRVVWNGSNNPAAFSVTPLDLSQLQYFNIAYVAADHATDFILQVYSDATHCSQATIASYGAGGGSSTNVQIPPGAFVQCAGAAGLAASASIKRIQISFTPFLDIDTQLRGVAVVRNEPPVVRCGSKSINGSNNYKVTSDGPYQLDVTFSVNNSGGSSSPVSVTDDLPPNMSYVGPTVCANGFVMGEPDLTNPSKPLWTSTSSLSGPGSVSCTFKATLSTLAEGATATDIIRAGIPQQPWGPEQCPASVSREAPEPPPEAVPTMNEWGMMLTAFLLAVFGGLRLRRRDI